MNAVVAGLGLLALSGALGRVGGRKTSDQASAELVSVPEAKKRIERRSKKHGVPPLDTLPDHIRPFADYMVRMSSRPLTPRDIVKAYVITRSSVQRQAAYHGTVCRLYPELFDVAKAYSTDKIRPEDVMSHLLFTDAGKRYLDRASHGEWNYETAKAAFEVTSRTKCFGFSRDLLSDMKTGSSLARRSEVISRALRTLPPEDWVRFVQREIPGVSAAKAGFFASLLGRGDVPTFDARELKLWRRDRESEVDVKPVDVMALRSRIRRWRMELDPKHEPFRQHLVHHALWDAYPGSGPPTKTTHAEVTRAVELAGARRRR
jgi:hypothetical protein